MPDNQSRCHFITRSHTERAGHARRLTPHTSCFSLSPQTWEIEREVMTEEGFFSQKRRRRRRERGKNNKESRVRVCAALSSKETPAYPTPSTLSYPRPMPRRHCCSHSNKTRRGGGGGVKKRGSVLKIREEFCCCCCLDLTNLVLRL